MEALIKPRGVIPAKERRPGMLESGAGICAAAAWIPACAGMTVVRVASASQAPYLIALILA